MRLRVDLPQATAVLADRRVRTAVAAGLGQRDGRHRGGLVRRETGLAGIGIDLLSRETRHPHTVDGGRTIAESCTGRIESVRAPALAGPCRHVAPARSAGVPAG